MEGQMRSILCVALTVLGIVGAPGTIAAQQPDGLLSGNIKYSAGQSVQPIFEGWTKNPDGSFNFWFGYLNRNHVQELHIPVGAGNQFDQGGADRGQPTYFYPRFNRQLFAVSVPANWGNKELIWTVTANGQSEKAVAWLRPDWEIAPPGTKAEITDGNQPPTVSVTAASQASLTSPLTLTTTVTDDGIPKARNMGRRTRRDGPPAFDYDSKLPPPVNVPQVEPRQRPRVEGRLQVEWFVWRGPAAVEFSPTLSAADKGPAVVNASFKQPGEYILRVKATDGRAFTVQDVKVVVDGAK